MQGVHPARTARVAGTMCLVVLVVGDRRAIEAGVRALNLGPIKVLTVDEALGPVVQ